MLVRLRLTVLILGGALGILQLGQSANEPGADEALLKQAGIATDGPGLVAFFRTQSLTAEEIQRLVRRLGDDDYAIRNQATRDLLRLGPVAVPFLRKASMSDDAEVRRRAEECLRQATEGPRRHVVVAAARLLVQRHPPEAAEALLNYVPRVEGEPEEEDLVEGLKALAVHEGKPEPGLVAGLSSPDATRRALAGIVLAGSGQALEQVRRLLADPEPNVRFRVAMALVNRKEKEAIPILVDLIPALNPTSFSLLQEFFTLLSADAERMPPARDTPEARKTYQEAWKTWWAKEKERVDLTQIEPLQFKDYTMVVLLDQGVIMEVDGERRERWRIRDLELPLDAQLLPGGQRVLVAEHDGNRVTERTVKGNIVWQKDVEGPLLAQRLPNGNTLIGTRTELTEWDRAGSEVFKHRPRPPEMIMRAQKAPSGEIVVVTHLGWCYRLDPTGKETVRFRTDVRTYGGRVEILPNGHFLIPLMTENRVVEYNREGKIIWEAPYPDPVAAVRARNGQTIVTSMQSQRTAGLDAQGKEIWRLQVGARVTRAWRR